MIRIYLKLHLWLKAKCERLTFRQRRVFLYSVSAVYFLCSVGLIVSAFIPEKDRVKMEQTEINTDKTKRGIPELIDTSIQIDSPHIKDTTEQIIT